MYTSIEQVFSETLWNVQDQNYYCTLVNRYRFPIERVQELYQFIINEGKCDTFEAEYEAYLANKQN